MTRCHGSNLPEFPKPTWGCNCYSLTWRCGSSILPLLDLLLGLENHSTEVDLRVDELTSWDWELSHPIISDGFFCTIQTVVGNGISEPSTVNLEMPPYARFSHPLEHERFRSLYVAWGQEKLVVPLQDLAFSTTLYIYMYNCSCFLFLPAILFQTISTPSMSKKRHNTWQWVHQ